MHVLGLIPRISMAVLFVIFSHVSYIDDDYSTIYGRNDMIYMQNGAFTTWLHCKVYCKLIGGFLRLLQYIEGHDVRKKLQLRRA